MGPGHSRREFDRTTMCADSTVEVASIAEHEAKTVVRLRVIRSKRQSASKLGLRSDEVPLVVQGGGEVQGGRRTGRPDCLGRGVVANRLVNARRSRLEADPRQCEPGPEILGSSQSRLPEQFDGG